LLVIVIGSLSRSINLSKMKQTLLASSASMLLAM
jgi:hypothetical protein